MSDDAKPHGNEGGENASDIRKHDAAPPPPPTGWGKAAASIVGLVLVLFGLGMVIPDGDTGQSLIEHALGALMAALGAAILATTFLPHKLDINGKQVQPLGIDLKASGGMAVFIVALLFIFAILQLDKAQDEAERNGDTDSEQEDGNAQANDDESAEESAEDSVEDREEPARNMPEEAQQELRQNAPPPLPPGMEPYWFAETWDKNLCSDERDCAFVGFSEGATEERAIRNAVEACYREGGGPGCEIGVATQIVDPAQN